MGRLNRGTYLQSSSLTAAPRPCNSFGEDASQREPGAWRTLARYLRDCQLQRIGQAVARQCSLDLPDNAPLVGAGVGRFLVSRLAQRLERPYFDILTLMDGGDAVGSGVDAGDCAPGAAVALLGVVDGRVLSFKEISRNSHSITEGEEFRQD